MKVTDTQHVTVTGPSESVGGAKVDPEMRPVLTVDTVVNQAKGGEQMLPGTLGGENSGGLGATVAGVHTTHTEIAPAHEVAENISRGQCGHCRHFKQELGQQILALSARGSTEERRLFNKVKDTLYALNVTDHPEAFAWNENAEGGLRKQVNDDMDRVGVCAFHTKMATNGKLIDHDSAVLSLPESSCADGGLPDAFEASDAAIDAARTTLRDMILFAAEDEHKKAGG